MADRFYIKCPLGPGLVTVTGPEAHHLAVVCRVRAGNAVTLFNGDGYQYPGLVREAARQRVIVEVLASEAPPRELGFRLELAAPLPKGDRAHFLLEKLTELGVTDYVPLRTRRSVVHPGASHLQKLERYVIEASKQCGRNVLLRVWEPMSWEVYSTGKNRPSLRYLGHPGGSVAFGHSAQDVALAVGPEGGFTEEELAAARQAGWQPVGLGPRTLRVETAALVLAAWVGRASHEPGTSGARVSQ